MYSIHALGLLNLPMLCELSSTLQLISIFC